MITSSGSTYVIFSTGCFSISQILFATTTSQTTQFLSAVTDNLLWYGKSKELTKFRHIWSSKDYDIVTESAFARFEICIGIFCIFLDFVINNNSMVSLSNLILDSVLERA